MTSILKVDQLQDSGGNALITSDGAGNITPGSLNIANAQIASNAAIDTSKLGSGAVLRIYTGNGSSGTSVTGGAGFTNLNLSIANIVINSGETPLVYAHISTRKTGGTQQHASVRIAYSGSSSGFIGNSSWGFGIQTYDYDWGIYNISAINIKNDRSNPFSATGTFTFQFQGKCIGNTNFGGESGNLSAGYSPLQAAVVIVKD